jgi:hypothetical protein
MTQRIVHIENIPPKYTDDHPRTYCGRDVASIHYLRVSPLAASRVLAGADDILHEHERLCKACVRLCNP